MRGFTNEDAARWNKEFVQPSSPADDAARELGRRIFDRALEMRPEEWRRFRQEFQALLPRQRLLCWSGVVDERRPASFADRASRVVAVHSHVIDLILDALGVDPEEG